MADVWIDLANLAARQSDELAEAERDAAAARAILLAAHARRLQGFFMVMDAIPPSLTFEPIPRRRIYLGGGHAPRVSSGRH